MPLNTGKERQALHPSYVDIREIRFPVNVKLILPQPQKQSEFQFLLSFHEEDMGLSHKLPVHWVPLPRGEELMSSSCMKLIVQQGGQAPMQGMVIHIVGNGCDSPNTEGEPHGGQRTMSH